MNECRHLMEDAVGAAETGWMLEGFCAACARENAGAAFRDAERYRWLRAGNAYMPEENFVRGGEDLDKLCDEALASQPRVITRVMTDGIETKDGAG